MAVESQKIFESHISVSLFSSWRSVFRFLPSLFPFPKQSHLAVKFGSMYRIGNLGSVYSSVPGHFQLEPIPNIPHIVLARSIYATPVPTTNPIVNSYSEISVYMYIEFINPPRWFHTLFRLKRCM